MIQELEKQLQDAAGTVPVKSGAVIAHLPFCDQYRCARVQRITELKRGLGAAGTQGYADRGCYTCTGFSETCRQSGDYTTYLWRR